MASDIMWADGEQLAQIMHLIGVEPVWKDGQVKKYRIIPVAMLDEPIEKDYLRKHALAWEKTHDENTTGNEHARIFASTPGTYGNGVNLAVYASAWKEEKDLSDIFVHWNGYAYGKNNFGAEAHDSLVSQLKTVDLTFNKTVTC
jgi:cobaltochelatase CobN